MTRQPSRPARRAARLARLLSAAAFATSVLSAPACSSPPPVSGSCGVVVDGTQSGEKVNGFDALSQLHTHLDGFLTSTGCRFVVFAPIDGNSLASPCTEPLLDMDPPQASNYDPATVVRLGRQAALRSAEKLLSCARTDPLSTPGRSDVIGGLARIADERPNKSRPFNVLVVSDFINYDSTLNLLDMSLATPAIRAGIISKMAAEDLLPDLRGIHVYTAGFALLFGNSPERASEFRAFWSQFMTSAQAASFKGEQS